MEFARKQMEKYGWKEGEGLGKNKSGIARAIKPKLKFDTAGLGHDNFYEIHDTWWEKIYDEAAKNLFSEKILQETDEKDITVKRNKKKSDIKKEDCMYNGFIKTSELRNNRENKIKKNPKIKSKHKKKKNRNNVSSLTEDELFQICNKRTLHKTARHGLNLNGKLTRLQEQENKLLQHV